MTDSGVFEAIGKTPLVELTRLFAEERFRVFAKLEGLNPGGSAKDRPAYEILRCGLESGVIEPGATVIESSSGNMGIGLAQVCARFGLPFICVVDPRTEEQNIKIMRAYGAEVEVVQDPDPVSGDFLQARLARVQQLSREIRPSFWPNQYANPNNTAAHYRGTMSEIIEALGRDLDFVFCATSTTGTVMGCGEYAREHGLGVKVVAVDAVGSVIFGGERSRRLIPGFGAARIPELCRPRFVDHCVYTSDLDCIVGCRRLVANEGILAGGSSGGVVMAVEQFKASIPPGSTCAVVLPDRGERYVDTVYNDDWVRRNFGDVAHMWQESGAREAWVPMSY